MVPVFYVFTNYQVQLFICAKNELLKKYKSTKQIKIDFHLSNRFKSFYRQIDFRPALG